MNNEELVHNEETSGTTPAPEPADAGSIPVTLLKEEPVTRKELRRIVAATVALTLLISIMGTVFAVSTFLPQMGLAQNPGGSVIRLVQNLVSTSTPATPAVSPDEPVVKVVEQASPAVVSIVASKDVPIIEEQDLSPFQNDPFFRQFFGDQGGQFQIQQPQQKQNGTQKQDISAGTGFIVTSDGMIVTNKHVVSDASADYTVLLSDGSKVPAKVLARDPVQDLAIVKIDKTNLPTLRLGDSSDIKIGQTAIVIGNALGEFRNTVSLGVVSGLQRSVTASGDGESPEELDELIQTDAAINPGNSGGPLLNLEGEVIGVDVAMAEGAQSIGFALPINKAKRAINDVKTKGRIIYPFLGVRYITINADVKDKYNLPVDYGAYIHGDRQDPGVVASGPAAKAGLKEGDIILDINGKKLTTGMGLAATIQEHQVGDIVTLHILRGGAESDVKVTLEERK